jgi:hypothetical protein
VLEEEDNTISSSESDNKDPFLLPSIGTFRSLLAMNKHLEVTDLNNRKSEENK